MALPLEDRASLRSLLAARFPKADDMANAFFMRMETAILDYAVRAAYVESIPGSDREFRADCLSVAKHADALLRLLDGDGAFPNLLALEITPTRLVSKRNSALQMQHVREQAKLRKSTLAGVQESLRKLSAAAKRGVEEPFGWGTKRDRGRPRGLSDVQIRLAVDCCEALQSINVRPVISRSKRERWVKDREAEYPALLRWALMKAGRRTASGKVVIGDVNGIALKGLKLFEARP